MKTGSSTGQTVAGITGSGGSARSLLYYPTAISVLSNGSMYIMDSSNYRVLKWQVGEPLGYIVAGGGGNGAQMNQIGASYQLFIDNQYNVYVSENSNHRVTKWSNSNSSTGYLVSKVFSLTRHASLLSAYRSGEEMVQAIHQRNSILPGEFSLIHLMDFILLIDPIIGFSIGQQVHLHLTILLFEKKFFFFVKGQALELPSQDQQVILDRGLTSSAVQHPSHSTDLVICISWILVMNEFKNGIQAQHMEQQLQQQIHTMHMECQWIVLEIFILLTLIIIE